MRVVLIMVALCLGTAIWFWLFALGFNMSYASLAFASLGPLIVTFFGAVLLGLSRSVPLALVSSALLLPTVLLNSFLFISVWAEGRFEATYLIGIGMVSLSCFVGAYIGWLMRERASALRQR